MKQYPILNNTKTQLNGALSKVKADITYIPTYVARNVVLRGGATKHILNTSTHWFDKISSQFAVGFVVAAGAGAAITTRFITNDTNALMSLGAITLIGWAGLTTFIVVSNRKSFEKNINKLWCAWRLRGTPYTHNDVMTAIAEDQWDHECLPYVFDNPSQYRIIAHEELEALNSDVMHWNKSECTALWKTMLNRTAPVRHMDVVLLHRLHELVQVQRALEPTCLMVNNIVDGQSSSDVVLIEDPQHRQSLGQQLEEPIPTTPGRKPQLTL